jgi:hypothetical protein
MRFSASKTSTQADIGHLGMAALIDCRSLLLRVQAGMRLQSEEPVIADDLSEPQMPLGSAEYLRVPDPFL